MLLAYSMTTVDSFYARSSEQGLKPVSVRRIRALIGAALHQAERWDPVDKNVARRARPRHCTLSKSGRQAQPRRRWA
jgi:hypothetical protein